MGPTLTAGLGTPLYTTISLTVPVTYGLESPPSLNIKPGITQPVRRLPYRWKPIVWWCWRIFTAFALTLPLIFVYMVMASLFESFIHPVTILFSIPFPVIGVSILFYLTGTTLNSNSWLGIMVLCGVAVNNGIILVDHINHLRKQGLSRREAIITGGQKRLRPILMTVATTLLGLMPLVAPLLFPQIFGPTEGRAGQYGPIALALVGGWSAYTFLLQPDQFHHLLSWWCSF